MSARVGRNRKRAFSTSVEVSEEVDIDISADDMADAGWHHEEDCLASGDYDGAADVLALSDWHDNAHGLSLWASCVSEPCKLLTDEFRSTP